MPITFPTSKLTVLVEIYINGTWTDVSAYVLWSDRVAIVRGGRPGQRRGSTSRCTLTFENSDKRFSPRNVSGPYFGYLKSGTPVRVSVDPGTGSERRFTGEFPSWTPQLRGHPNDRRVTLTAVGVLDGIERDGTPLQSAPRRYLPGTAPLHYWPMEDGQFADERGRPDSGSTSLYPFSGTYTSGAIISEPQWGSGQLAPWLSPVLSRSGAAGATVVWAPVVMPASPTTWTIDHMFAMGTDVGADAASSIGATIDVNPTYLGGTSFLITLQFAPALATIAVNISGTIVTSAALPGVFDGRAHHLRWTVSQSGANITWTAWVDGVSVNTGTTGALTLPVVTQLALAMVANASSAAQGHLAIWNTAGPTLADAVGAAFGWRGELATERFLRLLGEEGYTGSVLESDTDSQAMGPQSVARLADLLRECEDVNEGLITEDVNNQLQLISRTDSWGALVALTLDYDAGDVRAPLTVADDVEFLINDWTITRQDGATAEYASIAGGLSSLDYPVGVGPKPEAATMNLYTDDQALAHATFRANRDSIDKPRFPEVRVNLAQSPNLITSWLAVFIGNRIVISNPADDIGPNDADTTLKGFTERFEQTAWDLELYLEPGDIVTQVTSYDASAARWDCPASTLNAPLDTTETAVKVAVNCTAPDTLCRWAHDDGNYVVATDGETMTVTAITNPAITHIADGTAAHADNASTTPGLPAGMAKGDLMLIWAAIRNTSAAPAVPTGYSRLVDLGNAALFGKIHSGTESAPVVTYSGGSAGDTTSAQMSAFRSAQLSVINAAAGAGGSTQDIATPAMDPLRGRCLILALGWKADDWTSVTPPAGYTEIGEPSSTLGSDQGITWAYSIQTTPVGLGANTFTVTGGAVATVKSALVSIAGDVQTLTVTRSTNGVVKTHTAGWQLSLATPARWAL